MAQRSSSAASPREQRKDELGDDVARLTHRFVAGAAGAAWRSSAWNVYIAFNNHGIIEGEVRDKAGAPMAGATVIFFERNFIYYEEKQRATTDAARRSTASPT